MCRIRGFMFGYFGMGFSLDLGLKMKLEVQETGHFVIIESEELRCGA